MRILQVYAGMFACFTRHVCSLEPLVILFALHVYVSLHYSLPCPAVPCPALPCPALPCPALPCPALPCPALPCLARQLMHSCLWCRHTYPGIVPVAD